MKKKLVTVVSQFFSSNVCKIVYQVKMLLLEKKFCDDDHFNVPKKQETMDRRSVAVRDIDCYYTKRDVLSQVLDLCSKHVLVLQGEEKSVVYVDFSAGKNEFSVMLHEKFSVPYVAYDVHPGAGESFEGEVCTMDWFDVQRKHVISKLQVPVSSKVAIILGLNPPFGYQARTAKRFINHGVEHLSPELLFQILPYMGEDHKWVPVGYTVIEKVPLPEFSFYDSRGGGKQEKDVPTNFIVLKKGPQSRKRPLLEIAPEQAEVIGLTMRRPGKVDRNNLPCIAIRRSGVNAGHQMYIVTATDTWYLSEQREMHKNLSWNQQTEFKRKHAVESLEDSTWWKLYFDGKKFPVDFQAMEESVLFDLAYFLFDHVREKLPWEMNEPDVNTRHLKLTILEWLESECAKNACRIRKTPRKTSTQTSMLSFFTKP